MELSSIGGFCNKKTSQPKYKVWWLFGSLEERG